MPLGVIYIDRSRIEARQECPRMRFWEYDYDGTGIARSSGALPLLAGIAIHAAHARLLEGQTIDRVINTAMGEYATEVESKGVFGEMDVPALILEQQALLEGMVRLWAKWRLPLILAEYTVESIEQAWEWELAPGLKQRLRMDAILRRKDDGLLHILDYKSASYPSEDWRNKFEHNLQTELYVQALKERTGEPVGGMLYEGLIKGMYRKDTSKLSPFFGKRIQSSPYCYAYLLEGPDGQVWSADYTAKKGFQKVRITDHMTTERWVEDYLQHQVKSSDMFVVVPPICPPPFELERIKRQVVNQELQYAESLAEYRRLLAEGYEAEAEQLLDIFAWQNGNRCYKYGIDNRCPFVAEDGPCWTTGVNPLEDGGFERRTPHHEGEVHAG